MLTLRGQGSHALEQDLETDIDAVAAENSAHLVNLNFDCECPPALQCAEEILFCYAPGYSSVSLFDALFSAVDPAPPRRRFQWEAPYDEHETLLAAPEAQAFSMQRPPRQPAPASDSACSSRSAAAKLEVEYCGKREDG